jgi:hypothetical protein
MVSGDGGARSLGGNHGASSKSPSVGPKCSQSEGVPGPSADANVGVALESEARPYDPCVAAGPMPCASSGGRAEGCWLSTG